MNTMLEQNTDGESGGEEGLEFSHLLLPFCFFASSQNILSLFKPFWIFYSQLELCGGLTPILERSARASCDESYTQNSLLAVAEKPSNSSSYQSEDNSIIHYTPMVCYTTPKINILFIQSIPLLSLLKNSSLNTAYILKTQDNFYKAPVPCPKIVQTILTQNALLNYPVNFRCCG